MFQKIFQTKQFLRFLTFSVVICLLSLSANAQRKNVWNWQYLTKSDKETIDFQMQKDGVIYLEESSPQNIKILTTLNAKNGMLNQKTPLQKIESEYRWQYKFEQIEVGKSFITIRTANDKLFLVNRADGKLLSTQEAQQNVDATFAQILNAEESVFVTGNETGFKKTSIKDGKDLWIAKKCFDVGYSNESTNQLVLSGNTVIFTCASGKLYAYDTQNGNEKWQANYGQNSIANILNDDKNIYVLVEYYAGNGLLQALDIETGKVVWENSIEASNLYNSSFLMNNRQLFVNPLHGSFRSFEAETGNPIWEIPKTEPEMRPTDKDTLLFVTAQIENIVFSQGKMFGTSNTGFLYALDEKNGKIIWQTKVSEDDYFSPRQKPLILGKTGYLDLGETLYAFNTETGKTRWTLDSPVRLIGSDDAANLYFAVGGIMIGTISAPEIDKIARTTKKIPLPLRVTNFLKTVKSRNGSGNGVGSGNGQPREKEYSDFEIVGDKAFYTETVVEARKGSLYELNLQNGQQKQLITEIETTGLTKPKIQGNFAYLGSSKSVIAINLEKPEIAWQFETNAAVTESVLSADDKIIFSSRNGTVYALDNNGKLLWEYQSSAEFPSFDGGLAFAEGLLYVSMSQTQRSNPSQALAVLDAKNGEVRWTFQKDAPLLKPFVYGDKVFIGDVKSRIFALDNKTGGEKWSAQLHRNAESIDFKDNLMLIKEKNYDGWTTCLAVDSGRLLWERKTGSSLPNTIISNEIKLFDRGWTLNLLTGEKIKRMSVPENMQIIKYTPKVILATNRENLSGIDVETGKVLWSISR